MTQPLLTSGLPGIGGILKHQPEDFIVEEIPAYLPTGEGEHLFLWLEKRDLSGEQLLQVLAKALEISRGKVGMAGLKDKRAVTRQWISVPARCEARIGNIDDERIRILEAKLHRNKLKTGHHRGNKFEILVRDCEPDAQTTAANKWHQLQQFGFPNYFGEQRFGNAGNTLQMGLDLLRGERKPGSIPYQRRQLMLRLALSSVQSELFNRVLAKRIESNLLRTVLKGDVMQVRETGGLFVVEEVDREQQRYWSGETSLTGPLFGPKMKSPTHIVLELERAVLNELGLTMTQFEMFPKLTSGTRRPLLVQPLEFRFEEREEGIRFRFSLPPGSYATILMREFQEPSSLQ